MKRLEIWCWNKKIHKDSVWLDCVKLPSVDIVHDLDDFPYPFEDETFDEIYAHMVLEHVNDFMKTMKELYRILKKWWIIDIQVPYYLSTGAFSDPTHKTFFTEETFNFFMNQHDLNYYTNVRFTILKKELYTSSSLFGKIRNRLPFKNILKYFIRNYYSEIHIVLQK